MIFLWPQHSSLLEFRLRPSSAIFSQVIPSVYKYNSSLRLTCILSALSFYPLAAILPIILDSTRRIYMKGAILVGLFLIHTSAWVLCTSNARIDYYHNEFVYDACPQDYPSQISVGAAMFTMAAMVWMPPLFDLYLSVVICFY